VIYCSYIVHEEGVAMNANHERAKRAKWFLLILALLFFLLGSFVSVSNAVEVTLLGPNQYVRSGGDVDVYTETISGEQIAGEATVIVLNGKPSGEDKVKKDNLQRVSDATLYLNGVEFLGSSNFNKNVYEITVMVTLLVDNSLTVELRSAPGSYLTVEVVKDVPPCIDNDSDGYGNPVYLSCLHPEEDCDDSDATSNPGISENQDVGNCYDGKDKEAPALEIDILDPLDKDRHIGA